MIFEEKSKTMGQVQLNPKRSVACRTRKIKGAKDSFQL